MAVIKVLDLHSFQTTKAVQSKVIPKGAFFFPLAVSLWQNLWILHTNDECFRELGEEESGNKLSSSTVIIMNKLSEQLGLEEKWENGESYEVKDIANLLTTAYGFLKSLGGLISSKEDAK